MADSADESATDRDIPVLFPAMGRKFPSPASFDDVSLETDIDQLSKAPWFQQEALEEEAQISSYAVNRWLPANVPVDCVFTP